MIVLCWPFEQYRRLRVSFACCLLWMTLDPWTHARLQNACESIRWCLTCSGSNRVSRALPIANGRSRDCYPSSPHPSFIYSGLRHDSMDSVEDPFLAKEMLKLLGQELKTVRQQLEDAHRVRDRSSLKSIRIWISLQKIRETPSEGSSSNIEPYMERAHASEAENVDLKAQIAELRKLTSSRASRGSDDYSGDDKSRLQLAKSEREKEVIVREQVNIRSLVSFPMPSTWHMQTWTIEWHGIRSTWKISQVKGKI